jgi:protein-tyrosine phosphatase
MWQIEYGIWQGGTPTVLPLNIRAIVNLDCDHQTPYIDASGLIRCQVLLPIMDGPFPGLCWLRMAFGIVKATREIGDPVYIHCREGVSRSVMLTAAYLMGIHSWSFDTAMEVIAAANPKANPNRDFVRGLRQWQEELSA